MMWIAGLVKEYNYNNIGPTSLKYSTELKPSRLRCIASHVLWGGVG